jgi:hypothetical protein
VIEFASGLHEIVGLTVLRNIWVSGIADTQRHVCGCHVARSGLRTGTFGETAIFAKQSQKVVCFE